MKVWAWRGKKPNFGDELGPVILERVGIPVERVEDPGTAELLAIGSILGFGGYRPGTLVWGAGLMSPDPDRVPTGLEFVAVRGRLTAMLCGCGPEVPLGDPAILVSSLWPRPKRRYGLGAVPHYIDTWDYSWADLVIDVSAPVDQVIEQIASCSAIVSSSLHGLIVAQSFGIPAMRIHHPDVLGGNFKWADYQSAWTEPLEELQERMLEALRRATKPGADQS